MGSTGLYEKSVDLNPTTNIIVQGYGDCRISTSPRTCTSCFFNTLTHSSCTLAVFWSYLAIICWDILGHPDVREFEAPNLQCHLSLSFQCAGQKAHERQKWWWEFSFRPKRCIIWCFFLPLKNGGGFIHMMILQPQARRPLAQSHDVGSSGQVPQHDQWPQEWNRRMEGNNCWSCSWSNGQWLHVP